MTFEQAKKMTPHLPWCNDDPRELGPCVVEFAKDYDQYRRRWSQRWFENFQFIYGNHNIKWSRKYDFAVDTDFLRKEQAINKESQTNVARTVAEAISSMIYGSPPAWETTAPDESNSQGKRFQKIVSKLLECYHARLNCETEFKQAAMMYVTFGQVAWKVDFNKSGGSLKAVPRFEKSMEPVYTSSMVENPPFGLIEVPQPALDMNGQPIMQERWMPALDYTGKQIIDYVWTGDGRITTLSPFQYSREVGVPAHKSKWWQEFRVMDYDDYLKEYGKADGATGLMDDVVPGKLSSILHDFALRQFMRMHYTTPLSSIDMQKRVDNFKFDLFRHKVFVIEHYDAPNEEMWPTGRKLVIANGLCTHVTKPDSYTNKLDGWHPFSEAQWLVCPPSSMATGPMNDAIAKNRELNVLDSLTATAMHRNLGSITLVKTGSGLDAQDLSGTPGQIKEVASLDDTIRHVRDAEPIPPVIEKLREAHKNDIFESSGAENALRGKESSSATSGYMLKQEEEREQKRLTPARKEFARAIATVGEKLFACIKQNMGEVSPEVMGFLKRSAAGEFTEQDIIALLNTPIDYGVDVNVEESSLLFKSKATQQATYMDLAKGPLAQRLSMDAEVLDKFLEFFEADGLRDSSSPHRDCAVRENQTFTDLGKLGPDAQGTSMPIVIFEDDDDIHIAKHVEDVVRNKENLISNIHEYEMRTFHIEWHRMQKKEKMGEVPPGSAYTFSQQYPVAKQNAPRQLPQIAQEKVAGDVAKQSEESQNRPDNKPPSAPSSPSPVGGPPNRPTDAQAPSENTPNSQMGAAS